MNKISSQKTLQLKNTENISGQLSKCLKEDSSTSKLITRCLRCGRKLQTVAAQMRGYGDVCYSKILKNNNSKKLFNFKKE